MMKRMFGFCWFCAKAGVLTGPDNAISIVVLSSEAQVPLSQPDVLRGGVPVGGDGSSGNIELNMATLSCL
jgi:hypothetical protein